MFDSTKTLVLYRKNPLPYILMVTVWLMVYTYIGFVAEFDRSEGEHIFYYIFLGVQVLLGVFFYLAAIKDYIKYKKEVPAIYIENDILYVDGTIYASRLQIPFFQIKEAKMSTEPNNKNTITIKYYPGIVPKYLIIKDEYHIDIDTILRIILDVMN